MSESEDKEDPPKHFSAFAYEKLQDPGTLSLSDSDPDLSDDAEVVSLTPDEEEEDEEEEETKKDVVPKSFDLPFSLKGTDASFSQRSIGIFGGLQELQKSSPLAHRNTKQKRKLATSLLQKVERENSDSGSVEQSSIESKAAPPSIVKAGSTSAKPPAPAGRVPDYLEHPERWTKYSLEGVPDTSDRTNRSTAINFLTGLQQRKDVKEVSTKAGALAYNQDSSSSGEGRILFNRPQKDGQGNKEKSGLHLGKLHMPEPWGDEAKEESVVVGEQANTEALGFHGFKKRHRKNLRPKAIKVEEEDSLEED